ncbi:MAG: hypothetical protein Ct9H300mP11_07320 [Chloroflexota bacterium]|nr:MAG: hypothetical protein Ct9H300mP11_07320 [Chloroflexota bacterium]
MDGTREETAGLDILKKKLEFRFLYTQPIGYGIRSLLNYHDWAGNRGPNGFPKTKPLLQANEQ